MGMGKTIKYLLKKEDGDRFLDGNAGPLFSLINRIKELPMSRFTATRQNISGV
jgi:hypothetical protein